MLKLMKYELRKQAFSKLIILIIAAIGEIIFFTGMLLNHEDTIGLAFGLIIMFAFGALLFIAFESIMTFHSDLKEKHSYMLFLTPNTTYSIIGAKVVSSALQVLIAGFAFVLLIVVNSAALIAKYSTLKEINEALQKFLKLEFNLELNIKYLVLILAVVLVTWITIISLSYFSITLSNTFLADKKWKGLISFIIFFIIILAVSKVEDVILSLSGVPITSDAFPIIGIVFHIIVTILTYTSTAWMLDKKVSV